MAFPTGLIPETFEEFERRLFTRDQVRDRSLLATLIEHTAARSRCEMCGAAVVSAVTLAEAIAEHYDLSQYQKEILASDLEDDAGFDFGNGSRCGQHSTSP
jgi:hypothetical protein